MVNTPTLHEGLELGAGELESSVSPKAKWDTDFPEVPAEHAYGVRSCSIGPAGSNYRPPRESICNDEEGLLSD